MSRVVGTDGAGLAAAAGVVRAGGVLLYPTETVYGLGGDAGREAVVDRVRRLKGRDGAKPVLVITDALARAAEWIVDEGAPAARIAAHEPPLAVTLLLPASSSAPGWLVGPDGLIGIRRTADSFCRALVAAAESPIVSTSANLAGDVAPASLADVAPALLAAVDLAVDAGRPLPGLPSTVARLDGERVTVVREGPVEKALLERLAAGRR